MALFEFYDSLHLLLSRARSRSVHNGWLSKQKWFHESRFATFFSCDLPRSLLQKRFPAVHLLNERALKRHSLPRAAPLKNASEHRPEVFRTVERKCRDNRIVDRKL